MAGCHDVREHLFGEFAGQRLSVETGVCSDSDEGSFELANVVGDVGGDEFEDIVGKIDLLELGLALELSLDQVGAAVPADRDV